MQHPKQKLQNLRAEPHNSRGLETRLTPSTTDPNSLRVALESVLRASGGGLEVMAVSGEVHKRGHTLLAWPGILERDIAPLHD